MSIEAAISGLNQRFPKRGSIAFASGDSIRQLLLCHQVPSRPGIYVVYANDIVVYVGKAGTIRTDGTWKDQGLRGRLCNRQGDVSRQVFFETIMADARATLIRIDWWVTVPESPTDACRIVIPSLAEAELLQAHLDAHGTLPVYNRGA